MRSHLHTAKLLRPCLLLLGLIVFASVPQVRAQSTTAVVEIPPQIIMTSEGQGFDVNDNVLTSAGGPVEFTTVGAPVTLPIAVTDGVSVLEYEDTGSGLTITPIPAGHLIRVPIQDESGSDTIRILLTVLDLVGNGSSASGIVTAIEIDLPTRSADLSSIDARVGTASVKVLGSLSAFPGQSAMTMTIEKSPENPVREQFERAAVEMGFQLDGIGFSTSFDKTGLDPSIASITLRMSLSRSWVDSVGLSNVRVMRLSDAGDVELLQAPVEDPDADDIQFNAESPNGLSTFVIAAVSAAPTPTPTPTVTPVPTVTATAVPTSEPTQAPVATPSTSPTSTPTSTAAPTPTPQTEGDAGTDSIVLIGALAVGAVLLGSGAVLYRRFRR